MKKFTLIVILLLIGVNSYSQRKPKIKGNKNVIEVRENLEPFTAIELMDDLDIVLQKATTEGYALELDENLLDVLQFKVDDGILQISSFYNITAKKKLEITVLFHELVSIKMMNGKISMQDVISGQRLNVETYGTSRLELNATADIMDITMEEISSGDFNLASDSLNLILKDRIDVKLYTTGAKNTIYMYKNASAKLEGTTDFLSAKLYGNTSLRAPDLQANDVLLITEDSPDIEVRALNTLRLSSKGGTRTKLYGEPEITILNFLDTSKLQKEQD
ncbi:GIN domain-containing protein [Maribacter ulvicola]|uniref:Putative auto-transporter adhesin, head GIN domain n=1 Tax=Maribacter ulvicola TaxID=228959 RepID=A0A1N6R463_9FLAO|nr:DUF2807 domain-containing protein [Maribacter ulvicola]SIQ23609.1 Putative auto-transporter adhesin, head GIN domain [Maribacter ulvicola]